MVAMTSHDQSGQRNEFTAPLAENLRRHPKRLVFPEGEDLRVIRVAQRLATEELAAPILLGNREKIRKLAEDNGIRLKFVKIIEPENASDLGLFCERLENIERLRGNPSVDAVSIMVRPHYFAAMMVQYGQADAMIAGNQVAAATVYRAVTRLVKPLPGVKQYFGVEILHSPAFREIGGEATLFVADMGVIAEPSLEQLAMIAIETGKMARHFLAEPVRVAMLSSSTRGSHPSVSAERMRNATSACQQIIAGNQLLRDISVFGEIQIDAAINPAASRIRLGSSHECKPAQVLVFPDLDSADIALKIFGMSPQVQSYGMFIQGLAAPIAQVPRMVSEEQLYGTALAVGVEAIKFHVLHPEGMAEVY